MEKQNNMLFMQELPPLPPPLAQKPMGIVRHGKLNADMFLWPLKPSALTFGLLFFIETTTGQKKDAQ